MLNTYHHRTVINGYNTYLGIGITEHGTPWWVALTGVGHSGITGTCFGPLLISLGSLSNLTMFTMWIVFVRCTWAKSVYHIDRINGIFYFEHLPELAIPKASDLFLSKYSVTTHTEGTHDKPMPNPKWNEDIVQYSTQPDVPELRSTPFCSHFGSLKFHSY